MLVLSTLKHTSLGLVFLRQIEQEQTLEGLRSKSEIIPIGLRPGIEPVIRT